MIKSERQYLAAKEQIQFLKDKLSGTYKPDTPEIVKAAFEGQVGDLLREIENQVVDYEVLKNQPVEKIPIQSMEDLMNAPIRYRIAKHMTVEEFSRKVEVHSRQIARYETEEYRNTTTETLLKILKKLDIHLSGDVRI